MRRILLSIALLVTIANLAFSQSPNSIPYQAVIRNSSGGLVANQTIKIRLSVRDSIASGTAVYRETHTATTTTLGMINLMVGNGTPSTGSFSGINWGSNNKFLQVEVDVTGGTTFTNLGTQQLMSVPYALYASNAKSADTASVARRIFPPVSDGDTSYWKVNSLGINYSTGNVGVGTSTPLARLHVSDSSVLFTGPEIVPPSTTSEPPASGAGTRMMWYPQKAAFRAGGINSDQWSKSNIGNFSFAGGYNNIASGPNSTCFGGDGIANGNYSVSMGSGNTASGAVAVSMGTANLSQGDYSTTIGYQNAAGGLASTAIGARNITNGEYSTSLGYTTAAHAYASTAIGMFNDPILTSSTTNSIATEPLFIIGNGSSDLSRSNAMMVLKNGNTGIGTNTPALSSGGIGLHLQNNTFSQLRLQSTLNNAGIELKSLNGNLLEIGADNSSQFYVYNRTLGQWRMLIDGTGNMGIGTATPTQKLHVIGNILATGTITSSSDLRYKQNILSINNPIQKIKSMRGVYYQYKTKEFPNEGFSDKQQVGVIAQEVEAVLPEVVLTDKNGYKSVDYSKIVSLLIEGIKEQQKQLDEQKSINKMLLERIEKIEKIKK